MNGVFTVSQINNYLAFKIKGDAKLKGILVSGEISNFTNHAKTGHFYFTLKDRDSSIKAVMFKNFASKIGFLPSSGMRVIVAASVQVYERDGACQLYVTDMQPDGIGALYTAFEQLKVRLSEEGLFAQELKKPIPKYPSNIGIITSVDAAALQDMLNIISRRYSAAQIKIYPCLVQGSNAPQSIIKAIDRADLGGNDILIVGRGGGSFEDLNAFNDEGVARAISRCKTPIISAVGHETDVTISDYAADLRAPTPSAAAELAVPELSEMLSLLEASEKLIKRKFLEKIDSLGTLMSVYEKKFEEYDPKVRFYNSKVILNIKEARIRELLKNRINYSSAVLETKTAALDNLSPLKIMKRGYTLVYKGDESVFSASELKSGDEIAVKFYDGNINAAVK